MKMLDNLDFLQSSQLFVRALKSAADPPYENGPLKIDIARQGWESYTLYVPRKADLILEWILTRFHKEKSKTSHENPLLDPAHWSLLADILTHPDDIHIVPLVTRISIPGLFSTCLALSSLVPADSRAALFPPVLRSLVVLWPIAIQRAGIDPLSECLWTSLSILDSICNSREENEVIDLLTLVLTAFRSAFDNANAAGKKKVYLALVQHQINPWLHAIRSLPSRHLLHEQLYCVGSEILLNPESLRASLETNPNASTSTDIFSSLFAVSIKSDPNSRMTLLGLLPRLTKSYFSALRKHRSSIFAGTQPGQQVHNRLLSAATRFGSACLLFLEGSNIGFELTKGIWAARVGFLAVIEEEAIFDYTENNDFTEKIRELGSEAIKVLDRAWDSSLTDLISYAIDALACLHRIEPDVLTPFIPQILERLAICSATASHSSATFLSQLVSYHSKTRTLHTFISLLLAAVPGAFSFLPTSDTRAAHRIVAGSPLLSFSFADELTASLSAFTTPSQAETTVDLVHTAMESSLPSLYTSEEPSRKRRKRNTGEDIEMDGKIRDESMVNDVLKFSVIARFGATTITALLQDCTRGQSAQRRRSCLDRLDTLVSGVLEISLKAEEGETEVSKKGKRERNGEGLDQRWLRESFIAAILRLWYELFARSGSPGMGAVNEAWRTPVMLDLLQDKFKRCMRNSNVHPEMQLESGRVLYARRASPFQEVKYWSEFDAILDYIEPTLTAPEITSDKITLKAATRTETALALWGLTLERYLSVVDTYASSTQLGRLVDLMVRARLDTAEHASCGSVLVRAMTSASFWEFSNIRKTFLAVLDKKTAIFIETDIQKWLSALVHAQPNALNALSNKNNVTLDDISQWVDVCRLLHYFPADYLSRSSKSELAERALIADVLLQALDRKNESTVPKIAEWRGVLRSFAVTVATHTQIKTFDDITSVPEWMPYMTLSKHAPPGHNEKFLNSTFSLLSLTYVTVIRAATTKGNDGVLTSIISYFIESNPFLDGNNEGERLAQQSLLRFVRILVREFKNSSFTTGVLSLLQQLCSSLDICLKPTIVATGHQTIFSEFIDSGDIIEAWQVLLSFRKWVSIKDFIAEQEPDVDMLGTRLLKSTTRILNSAGGPKVPDDFLAKIFSLLIQQGQMLPETECQHLGTIAAAYVLFTKSGANCHSSLCDELIAQASKRMSVIQFETFLGLVAEDMDSHRCEDAIPELESLLHLSMLLLRESPERTSKISYEHAGGCLRVFVNRSVFTDGPSTLVVQVLEFIHSQCIERAASFKLSDTACICTIVSRLLVGRIEHDDRTSPSIFRAIISIVDALIRLRRDLINPHLPQLSLILRQLIMVIRRVRPLLGPKQYHLVSDTLPKWLNPDDPLGEDEARILARVLTGLATKSLVRSHSSHDGQKAESLARPFARHAPYVLLAYIQLMNDPLCVLSVTMRRELEPGLFALCGMMGEHGRDTLMVQSLDVGGKALLKTLWKEYEKQKYIGGG